jgi:hypothetical protein
LTARLVCQQWKNIIDELKPDVYIPNFTSDNQIIVFPNALVIANSVKSLDSLDRLLHTGRIHYIIDTDELNDKFTDDTLAKMQSRVTNVTLYITNSIDNYENLMDFVNRSLVYGINNNSLVYGINNNIKVLHLNLYKLASRVWQLIILIVRNLYIDTVIISLQQDQVTGLGYERLINNIKHSGINKCYLIVCARIYHKKRSTVCEKIEWVHADAFTDKELLRITSMIDP